MAEFGATIRRLMRERRLTTRQFAERALVSLDTVGRALKMDRPAVNPTTYCALAAGLGLTPGELDDACRDGGGTAAPQGLGQRRPAGTAGLATNIGRSGRDTTGMGPDASPELQAEQLRRQVHAITDLLDPSGLDRVLWIASAELRRKLGAPPSAHSASITEGSSGNRTAQEDDPRIAAKPAGARIHALTRLAKAEQLRAGARRPAPSK